MKKPSSNIFDLIHAMSMNEKGYFKKYIAKDREGDSSYIILFDLIKKQKKYDEKSLFSDFKKIKKDISYRRFSRLKIYLYDIILKSLRMYHGEIKTVIALRNSISDLSILYDKALYKQCNSILKGIKKEAIRNEIFDVWLSALQMELVMVKHITNYEDQAKERKKILEEISEWKKIYEEYISYYGLLYTYSNKIDVKPHTIYRDPKLAVALRNEIMNHPLMIDKKQWKSKESKLLYARLKQIATGLVSPGKQQLSEDIENVLNVYETNKFLIEKEPNDFAIIAHNYILNNMVVEGVHTFKKNFKKFEIAEKLPGLSLNQHIGVLENSIRIKLLYYTNNFAELNYFFEHEYESIQKNLLQYKNDFRVKNLLLIYFLLFGLCFVNEDLKSASYWLNEIDDNESKGFRQDLKNLGKLYMLVIDYEKKNFELLESHLRSFLRQVKIYKLELSKEMFTTLEFFKKIEQQALGINRQNDLYQELEKVLKEMLKVNKLGHMKYLYVWLESRLSVHKMQSVAKALPPAFF